MCFFGLSRYLDTKSTQRIIDDVPPQTFRTKSQGFSLSRDLEFLIELQVLRESRTDFTNHFGRKRGVYLFRVLIDGEEVYLYVGMSGAFTK